MYTCSPTVADKCTYLTSLRGSKGGGAKGRSKEKSKHLLEESRSSCQVICRVNGRPEAGIKPLLTCHPQDEAQAMAMADLESGADDPTVDEDQQVKSTYLSSPCYNHTIGSLITTMLTIKC